MKYDKLPKSDLHKFHRVMPESKVLAEYKQKILELGEDELGRFTLSKGDVKPGTVKARLLRSAKSLDLKIEVKRFGDEVVFYKMGAVDAESKARKSRGRSRADAQDATAG